MKALTLKHPWAYAICHLGKRIENRSWRPSRTQLRPFDWFAIHGGAVPRGGDYDEASLDLDILIRDKLAPESLKLEAAVLPGIVAVTQFTGIITASRNPWFHGTFGWSIGPVLVLDRAVPCKGAQGLWDIPEDVLELVEAQSRKEATVER